MDKLTFCADMENRLLALRAQLDATLDAAAPSTVAAAQQMAEARAKARDGKRRLGELLARVSALRDSAEPDWEQSREDLERSWRELRGEFQD